VPVGRVGVITSRAICFWVFVTNIVCFPLWETPGDQQTAVALIGTSAFGWALFDAAIFLELRGKKNE
jgi:hypothetical protein